MNDIKLNKLFIIKQITIRENKLKQAQLVMAKKNQT
jgi:hypothetical protein